MKMESAKLFELLAASLLFLTLLTDPTAACMCRRPSALMAYCSSGFLVKLQVLDAVDYHNKLERQFKIKVTKVLKGPKSLKKMKKLYTSTQSSLCGYEHRNPFNKEEYLFTVRQYNDRLSTMLCDFNVKWDSLSHKDKKGLKGGFKGSCNSVKQVHHHHKHGR